MSSLDSTIITIPERVTGKLPIAYWDIYFNILTKRLAEEFPESDHTERTNVALGNLQIIACGNAALDSLAVSDLIHAFDRIPLTLSTAI